MSFFNFIKENIFWLSSILIIIISVWLTFFEIRKLKKCINNNGIQRNNVNEKSDLDNINAKEQIVNKEKYSEKEIRNLVLDISMELKKTNARLKNWRNFGIIVILFILYLIIKSLFT